ncbi:glycerophosphoryl diester phosphodiesterase membrane domain-containing protein [Granulicoccus phenolivorans]|uniref:glycerophosphoryl diester phosphodiesterase membrane domain-containing protein n=1 Tax=Granulicoccus phenolivorans TaxID=266854 RepID=UPI000767C5A0|nr:glycerophosphoryl diester phosphodiesterase membrane domain-containing protein [Granulicoccus phenolivorans]
MSIGEIFGGTWKTMTRNRPGTIGLAAVVCLAALIPLSPILIVVPPQVGALVVESLAYEDFFGVGRLIASFVILAVPFLVLGIAQAYLVPPLTVSAAEASTGRRPGISELLRASNPVALGNILWHLLWPGLFYTIGILVDLGIRFGAAGGGALLILAWWTVLLILNYYFGTRFAFVPTVLTLERLPLPAAIKQSWLLTRGKVWSTLGHQLAMAAICGTLVGIGWALVALIWISTLTAAESTTGFGSTFLVPTIGGTVLALLVGIFGVPAMTLSTTYLYQSRRFELDPGYADQLLTSHRTGQAPWLAPESEPSKD